MKIRAIFRGADGSLGYRNGIIYDLILIKNTVKLWNGKQQCVYSNTQKFLENWEVTV
jgi:hypothetical protein